MDADPHSGASLFQFRAGQFALTGGGEKALAIGSGAGGGLRSHRAQLPPLTEPAESDDVRVEMGRSHRHADDLCKRSQRPWGTLFTDALATVKHFEGPS